MILKIEPELLKESILDCPALSALGIYYYGRGLTIKIEMSKSLYK